MNGTSAANTMLLKFASSVNGCFKQTLTFAYEGAPTGGAACGHISSRAFDCLDVNFVKCIVKCNDINNESPLHLFALLKVSHPENKGPSDIEQSPDGF